MTLGTDFSLFLNTQNASVKLVKQSAQCTKSNSLSHYLQPTPSTELPSKNRTYEKISLESELEESDSEFPSESIIPELASHSAKDIIETANAIPINAWEMTNHHLVAKVLNSKLKVIKFIFDSKTDNLISPQPNEKDITVYFSRGENRFRSP
jgi:hypothetical protein